VALYAQKEVFGNPWTLYVLRYGMVAHRSMMLRAGAIWGEDQLLLQTVELLRPSTAVALTFAEVIMLRRVDLEKILVRYPTEGKVVRRAYARIAFQSAIRLYCCKATGRNYVEPAERERMRFLAFLDPDMSPMLTSGTPGLVGQEIGEASELALQHKRLMTVVLALSQSMEEEMKFRLQRLERNVETKVAHIRQAVSNLSNKLGHIQRQLKSQLFLDLEGDQQKFATAKSVVAEIRQRVPKGKSAGLEGSVVWSEASFDRSPSVSKSPSKRSMPST